MGEEKRHQMMQNLFGDQSEDEEEEIDSEHESNPQPNYASDEAEGGLRNEGEGEDEVEGNEEAEVVSDVEMREVDPDPRESEGEREASSEEIDIGDEREVSEAKDVDVDSDEKEEYSHRVATGRKRDIIESGSERSEEHQYDNHEDEEVDQARSPSKSPDMEKDDQHHISHSAAEIRDVFGASDDEEEPVYATRNEIEQHLPRSPMEEEGRYERNLRPEDMLVDEDARYESEEENIEVKAKEKPVGPPLELEIPFQHPPADPTRMHMIKISNIMGIDPNQFDPKTYVEDKTFVTDESGENKRIRLENNIVRWRPVRNPDGSKSVESNARFVRWSDGSLQLLIGNEVLNISVREDRHDQTHLFLRHNKSLLQSQGRILRKMKFMPSSLSSNSHKRLTALVDSSYRKVYKVKNCVTDIDPEREKEEKERAESQTIRANVLLNRKREKVNRKYTQTVERRRQLSPGFLEGALDEDDEPDYYDHRRSRRRFEEDLEVEARAERRIMNAKKGNKDILRKPSLPSAKSSKRPVNFSDSEREESEYESDGEEDERSPPRKRVEEPEQEYEEEEEEREAEAEADGASEEEEEAEEPKQRSKDFGGIRKRMGIESDEESPPRKMPTHRRMAVVYDSDEE
ncbi:protein LEO1 homolog [Ricinus communis]|uniref:RNA polymerase-associated protein LEO1, putative n=1 Tax=Ricinus communis TaxID=3988 RepID=B9RLP8_RICCO|nr:protein LEO1 homolog [Ricinus communis]EEF47773.1 RNA polymerase-associated protein LEO1, putative [Ricinus communis]|eukprot:XP_002514667.1 protein LEO1 homolog [Ricinus communis]